MRFILGRSGQCPRIALAVCAALLLAALAMAGCAASDEERLPQTGEDAPAATALDASGPAGAPGAAQSAFARSAQSLREVSRVIIREGWMDVEVEDVLAALAEARAIAERMGGRVDGSSLSGGGGYEDSYTYATLRLRVPSAAFDRTIEELRELGEVLSEQSQSTDVTEEYVDLEARLRNLRAVEERLLGFLERAEKVEELLSVQRELASTQGEIERVTGRMNYLSALADESSLTLNLTQEPEEPPVTGEGWAPGETAQDALRALVSVARFLGDAAIVAAVFSPLILLAAGAVWIGRRAIRRRRQRASEETSA
ncbi:MAG: DUF4349 domain-containing protein [Dehalococcoidia bacterium]|nr:DUF4349 domain-containing protein [Dehalococcoidia bacterium]